MHRQPDGGPGASREPGKRKLRTDSGRCYRFESSHVSLSLVSSHLQLSRQLSYVSHRVVSSIYILYVFVDQLETFGVDKQIETMRWYIRIQRYRSCNRPQKYENKFRTIFCALIRRLSPMLSLLNDEIRVRRERSIPAPFFINDLRNGVAAASSKNLPIWTDIRKTRKIGRHMRARETRAPISL